MGLLVHSFEHQHRICCQRELEGHPVEVEVFQTVTPWSGKEYPTTVTRWKGLHEIEIGPRIDPKTGEVSPGRTYQVLKSETYDSGPKLGITLVTQLPPDHPPTEEERRANRENLNRVIGQLLPGYRLAEM